MRPSSPPFREASTGRKLGAGESFLLTAVLLAGYNLARHLGMFDSYEAGAAIGLTLLVAAVAWFAKLSAEDLGLARSRVGGGAVLGAIAFAVVLFVIVVAAVVPATAGFLDDDRVDVSAADMVFEVFISTLVVTVIPEELAFRGVLLASGTARWGVTRAAFASSALFGLWHIAPTLATMPQNAQVREATLTVGDEIITVAASVFVTFVAGLLFCWLRVHARSLLAPTIAHFGTNSAAFVVAWVLAH